jgi:hypothetical protein
MYVDEIVKKKDLVPSFFSAEFFFDPTGFGGSEFFFENDIHFSFGIKE